MRSSVSQDSGERKCSVGHIVEVKLLGFFITTTNYNDRLL